MADDDMSYLAGLSEEIIGEMIDALAFYGDPSTYFAVGFFPDNPAGDFMEDFSATYLGAKPGKRAREMFEKLCRATGHDKPDWGSDGREDSGAA